ncbi:MAG TPA: FAD-dependent monooxygenase, partial [Propionibacterium sp.]|nr:FAD-dependent monooxygenase [Propionibacterium sp.]
AYTAERKPETDELQRISRQGWSEDEVNDVFPGQKRPGEKVGVDE